MKEGTEKEKMANTGDMNKSSCPLGKAFGGQPFWRLKKSIHSDFIYHFLMICQCNIQWLIQMIVTCSKNQRPL